MSTASIRLPRPRSACAARVQSRSGTWSQEDASELRPSRPTAGLRWTFRSRPLARLSSGWGIRVIPPYHSDKPWLSRTPPLSRVPTRTNSMSRTFSFWIGRASAWTAGSGARTSRFSRPINASGTRWVCLAGAVRCSSRGSPPSTSRRSEPSSRWSSPLPWTGSPRDPSNWSWSTPSGSSWRSTGQYSIRLPTTAGGVILASAA